MSVEHTLRVPAALSIEARSGGRISTAIRRQPLIAFFALAYAYSWSLSLTYILTGSGPSILSCGPFLAAVTVLAVTRGRSGIGSLWRSMRDWRVSPRWWVLALVGPVLLTAIATALNVAFGAPAPDAGDLGRWTDVIPVALTILLVPLFGGAWEEPGWRGYALPELLRTRSALFASVVLGLLWAFWHVPVFLTGDQHWSDLVLVVEVTVVLTWLFRRAGGSVLIAMAFHAMNNSVSGEYFSQMFSGSDSVRQSWMLVVVWGMVATAVAVLAPGFRERRS
jgi:membrane protease YdiL (CAAX protease family)